VVVAQLGFVHLHQPHLAHCRSGLQFVDFLGPRGPAQALHTFGHRAAGHHDHLAAHTVIAVHQGRQLARPFLNRCLVEATAFVGDQTGADLDHDAARILQNTG